MDVSRAAESAAEQGAVGQQRAERAEERRAQRRRLVQQQQRRGAVRGEGGRHPDGRRRGVDVPQQVDSQVDGRHVHGRKGGQRVEQLPPDPHEPDGCRGERHEEPGGAVEQSNQPRVGRAKRVGRRGGRIARANHGRRLCAASALRIAAADLLLAQHREGEPNWPVRGGGAKETPRLDLDLGGAEREHRRVLVLPILPKVRREALQHVHLARRDGHARAQPQHPPAHGCALLAAVATRRGRDQSRRLERLAGDERNGRRAPHVERRAAPPLRAAPRVLREAEAVQVAAHVLVRPRVEDRGALPAGAPEEGAEAAPRLGLLAGGKLIHERVRVEQPVLVLAEQRRAHPRRRSAKRRREVRVKEVVQQRRQAEEDGRELTLACGRGAPARAVRLPAHELVVVRACLLLCHVARGCAVGSRRDWPDLRAGAVEDELYPPREEYLRLLQRRAHREGRERRKEPRHARNRRRN